MLTDWWLICGKGHYTKANINMIRTEIVPTRDVQCPRCLGQKTIVNPFAPMYKEVQQCPICSGTGKVKAWAKITFAVCEVCGEEKRLWSEPTKLNM